MIDVAVSSEVGALLDEVGHKNRVQVAVFRACHRQGGPMFRKRVMHEESEVTPNFPSLALLDQLRIMVGRKPIFLPKFYALLGGELVGVTPNLRTTVGIDYVANSLGQSSGRPAVAEYIAVTSDATAPAAGDTTLTAEITTNGLGRAIKDTYNHSAGVASYSLVKTFTASGTHTNVQKAGLFNAAAAGTMFLENTFTATSLASGDQLSLTWTVNI